MRERLVCGLEKHSVEHFPSSSLPSDFDCGSLWDNMDLILSFLVYNLLPASLIFFTVLMRLSCVCAKNR